MTRIVLFSVDPRKAILVATRIALFSVDPRKAILVATRIALFSVDLRKAILVATRIAPFSVNWRKGNSRGDENYCLLCSSEKSSSRILSRVTENWAILVVNGEKQFSSRRELLDSLREFSNSRRNLDENCWIRGENPIKSRQPNCILWLDLWAHFKVP